LQKDQRRPVPAGLLIVTAVFLGLAGGVLGVVYAYPVLKAASNASSNLTQTLYREAQQQGLNYTLSQVQSLMRQTAYSLIAVSAFLAALGVVAWAFVYRPATSANYARAAMGALFTGVLYILTAIAGSFYTLFFGLLGGVLLLAAWYSIRSFSRSLGAQETAAGPSEAP